MATVDTTYSLFPLPALVVPPTAVTLDGFRAWVYSREFPENGRITFVAGRLIIEMSPERIDSHNRIKEEVSFIIGSLVRELDLGDFYPDGAWITNRQAGVSNEPDASFATWETLQSGKLVPPRDKPQDGKHIELVGTPDWVCEIVSDSSVEKDTQLLVDAYHQAGIREYWLIDARGSEISFQLLIWSPAGFQAAENRDGWHTSPVFGREFQFNRTRDRLNRWRYHLQLR